MSSKKFSINPDFYMPAELLTALRMDYQARCSKELSGLHLSNFLHNFNTVRRYPGIIGFEGALRGLPVVIVGAGPSLNKHLPLLKEFRKNLLVVAGDACLPVLVKHEVLPDLVVMVDSTEKQYENFKEVDTKQFYTVVPTVVHPSIFRIVDPKHLLVYNVKDPGSELLEMIPYHTGRKGGLPAGVLTSGSCFGFAAMAGCRPIMFIGHDLSWPTPDRVYADGIAEWKEQFQKSGKFRSNCSLFPDLDGKLVVTHQTFISFWAWLKESTQALDVQVINCSEAGILRGGMIKVEPFEKALKRWAGKELVGVKEKIEKAYNYEIADGLVEKLLAPKRRKKEVRV